jgi:hypothetical protein
MAISLGDNIKLSLGLPNDARYFSTTTNKPWTSCSDVTTNLAGGAGGVRYTGLTVNINGVEHWFKDGIEDSDLVEKTSGGGNGQLNWSGSTANAIGTYISVSGICAQPNLTFDGSVLNVTGAINSTGNVTINQGVVASNPRITFDHNDITANYIETNRSDNGMDFIIGGNNRLALNTTCATFGYKLEVPSLQVTTGAASGCVLTSDASGNATWQTAPTSAGGANNNIQFNNNGVLSGTSNLTYCCSGTYSNYLCLFNNAVNPTGIVLRASGIPYCYCVGTQNEGSTTQSAPDIVFGGGQGGTLGGNGGSVCVLAGYSWSASGSANVCIKGGYGRNFKGGDVLIAGGESGSSTDGGDVKVCVGVGGNSTNGNIFLCGLPSQTSETNIIYIDTDGSLASGVTSSSSTDLGYTTAVSSGTVTSSTGTNATIPAATTSLAGLMACADKIKLNGIAAGAQVNVATNLSIGSNTATVVRVDSSTGDNVILPHATATLAGVVFNGDQTFGGTKTTTIWCGTSCVRGAVLCSTGNVQASGDVRAATYYNSTSNAAVLNTDSAGTIYLRPTSRNDSAAQSTFSTTLACIGTPISVGGGGEFNSMGLDSRICLKSSDGTSSTTHTGIRFIADVDTRYAEITNTRDGSSTEMGFAINTHTGAGILNAMCILPTGKVEAQQGLDVNGITNMCGSSNIYGNLALCGNGSRLIQVGEGRTDDNYSYIDLVGDTTYPDFGLRILRGNGGANTASIICHRGTGDLCITTAEAADIALRTSNLTRFCVSSAGVSCAFNDLVSGGIITGYGIRTSAANTNFSLFTRTGGNTPLYVQQGEATGGIASFRYGSTTAGAGNTSVDINHDGIDVNGKTITNTLQVQTGAAAGCILTSDASGNATWQTPAGGATNLSTTHNTTTVVINSSTGTNATINSATQSTAGIVTTGTQTFNGTKTTTIWCGTSCVRGDVLCGANCVETSILRTSSAVVNGTINLCNTAPRLICVDAKTSNASGGDLRLYGGNACGTTTSLYTGGEILLQAGKGGDTVISYGGNSGTGGNARLRGGIGGYNSGNYGCSGTGGSTEVIGGTGGYGEYGYGGYGGDTLICGGTGGYGYYCGGDGGDVCICGGAAGVGSEYGDGIQGDVFTYGRYNRMCSAIDSRIYVGTSLQVYATSTSVYLRYANSNRLQTISNGICVTGCGYATDWIASSDIRLKDNVVPISCALSKIDMLCGVCYNLCEDGTPDMGLIAQEVEKIEPRLVSKGIPSDEQKEKYCIDDEVLGLKYDKFAGLFVEAIKELKEQNECLQNQIISLRQEIRNK